MLIYNYFKITFKFKSPLFSYIHWNQKLPLSRGKKIKKTDKPLARLMKGKKDTNYQFQEWKREHTTDLTDIKRIIKVLWKLCQ